MVEEPAQAVERHLPVDRLEHVEEAADVLAVGGVQAERPAVLDQQPHHWRQLLLHRGGQVGPWFEKILEVRRRVDQHLARPVHAVEVTALAGPGRLDPLREVVQLLLGPLGEQVIGDAEGHLAPPMQFLDHLVVVGVVLRAAPGIDQAREAQPVEFPHELPGRVHLLLDGQLRPLPQRGVQKVGVGPGDQYAGRVPSPVPLDFGSGRVRGVLGVAAGPQRRPVQERPIIQVQDEYRRIR